MKDRNMLEM